MPKLGHGSGYGLFPQTRKDAARQSQSHSNPPPATIPNDPMTLACTRYAALLTPKELASYQHATAEDLELEVRRLETHRLKSSKSFRIGKSIQPLVEFLKRHSEAVDTMVQANPYPAALVWGSFKVLLTVASHHIHYFDKLVGMLRNIGDTLDIYREYEVVLKTSTKVQDRLQSVYFDILSFLHKAKKVFQKRGSLILARTLWKTFESDFGNIIDNLKRNQRLLDESINITQIMHVQKIVAGVEGIETKIEEIKREQINQQNRPSNVQYNVLEVNMGPGGSMPTMQGATLEQRRQIMNWISNHDPQADFARESRRRVKASGQWLLNTNTFQSWQYSPDERILRIVGSPGSGKTVLSTTIVEYLQKQHPKIIDLSGLRSSCTAYFYCSKSEQNQDHLSILAGLIKQIVSQLDAVPTSVADCYTQSCKAGRSTLSIADNPEALLKSIASIFGKLHLVIDGLDEVSNPAESIKTLVELTDALPNVHTILLSRDIQEIHLKFPPPRNPPIIKLEVDNTSPDVNRYIREQLDLLDFDDIPTDVYDKLCLGANGMFLWATLMMKSLSEAEDLDDAMSIVSSMPRGLDEFYTHAMVRLLRQNSVKLQNLARRVVMLMCAASRPLKWEELESMLNTTDVDTDPEGGPMKRSYKTTILKACSPLIENITLPTGGDIFKFAHLSVREFFLSAIKQRYEIVNTGFPFEEVEAHTEVAGICLNYLLRSDKNKAIDNGKGLLEYASTFWGFHIIRATYSDPLAGKMHRYLSVQSRRQDWIAGQLFRESSGFPLQHLIKMQKQLHAWDIGQNTTAGDKLERLDWIQDVGRVLVDIDTATNVNSKDLAAGNSQITYFEKLMVIRDLSREYTIRQRLDEGEKWMTEALHRKQQERGKKDISTVWLLNSLGIIYDQQHKVQLSAETHERALAIQEAQLGRDHLETVWTINELGRVYRHLGRYDDAVKMHLRAFEALKKILPANDLQLAWTLNTLARAYRKQGDRSKALECHEKAMDIQKISLGDEHPHVLWAMADVGRCYRDEGNLKESVARHRICLEGRKKVLGLDHPDTLWAMNDLGLVLSEFGRREEARGLHEQALEGQTRLLGEGHPHTVWSKKQIESLS
ncbi:hypothetical protein TWF694_010452 [Orbilia ellipsospora]|uniref:NACHT domain-containing protein n=1 Tax=Orbilia ellipsospora TaxID=2528407 RepID=A0AAV9X9Y1_9PEZI